MRIWRRIRTLALPACLACGVFSGCETMKSMGLRPHKDSVAKLPAGSEDLDDESGASTRGFFKPSRRPAAMSSEARDIENSLGLGGL